MGAKLRLRDVSKNPANYKRLLTDFLVQVREPPSCSGAHTHTCFVGAHISAELPLLPSS